MDVLLFLKAALIGLSIAAPVGPVGLLCIQRTLAHGARIGFFSGLGAAAADATYGALGAFGISAVTQFFVTLTAPLAVGGAMFIAWMGLQLLRSRPAEAALAAPVALHAGRAFVSVFALTLTNPMTILSFVAVFAAIGGNTATSSAGAALMVLGVFSGSALWWLALAAGVARLRHKLGARLMQSINRLAGLFLLGFALWQVIALAA